MPMPFDDLINVIEVTVVHEGVTQEAEYRICSPLVQLLKQNHRILIQPLRQAPAGQAETLWIIMPETGFAVSSDRPAVAC